VRECTEEVRTLGGGPVAAIEFEEFWAGLLLKPREFRSDLLLKPKEREVSQPEDFLGDNEGVYSWGGTCMWGMRVYK
jgi:hypothetical protein